MSDAVLDDESLDPRVRLALAKRELELERRRLELQRDNELLFFKPHAKQELFFANASFHYRYARTGNRFGKSEMGAAEDIAFALGYRPWIAEGDPLRTLGIPAHPTKGLIVCTTWKKSREVFTEIEDGGLGKLFKYIPKSALVSYSKNHSGYIDRIVVKHVSGGFSTILLDTIEGFKKNPLAQESSVHDWVHVDEPIPEPMWKAISRGLVDRQGRAWFTCTPLSEPWIDAMFIPDLQDQMNEQAPTQSDVDLSRWMMTGTMDDNPHNKAESIRLFMSQLTPEEQEARRNGIPLAYSGIVYKEFSWNDHVLRTVPVDWVDWSTPPPDYCLRFAIDYHPRKPHAVLFIATSPLDIHYVYAEIWESCLMSELVTKIKEVLGPRGATVPGLIDPLAKTPNQVTDITPMDEVMRLGLPVLPATKDPQNGILRVKEILKARTTSGRPIIFFNPALPRTLFEISRGFVWDDDKNVPVKDNDDMMEDFYRLCLQGLSYVEPTSDADYSPIRPREIPDNVLDFSDFGGGMDDDLTERRAARSARYRR